MAATATVEELAASLFDLIVTDIPKGLPTGLEVPSDKRPRVENELIYLSLFLIELGVYLVHQDSRERHLLMDAFWGLVSQSGLGSNVIQERFQSYTDAVKTDDMEAAWPAIGRVFAWNCLAQHNPAIEHVGEVTAREVSGEIVRHVRQVTLKI